MCWHHFAFILGAECVKKLSVVLMKLKLILIMQLIRWFSLEPTGQTDMKSSSIDNPLFVNLPQLALTVSIYLLRDSANEK